MLSQEVIDVVKSTAPILEENGVLLTKHFYRKLFQNNPEVMPVFNKANQDKGTQQEALAGAICAYAKNIDNLEALKGAVELISHKHFSLKVKPHHYPIVGKNLLESIKDVLGDGATPEVINAWSDAYFFLADILMGAEKKLSESETGYEDFKKFKVIKKTEESSVITSFYLSPIDGQLPSFLPGQYITVRVPFDGISTMRNYSLSSMTGDSFLRISVKKEKSNQGDIPDGYVSNYLHDSVGTGDELEIGAPAGIFTLNEENLSKDIVLLAGGIGITPLLSMLYFYLSKNSNSGSIKLIHANQNESVQAFRDEISDLESKYMNFEAAYFYDSLKRDLKKNERLGYISKDYLEDVSKNQSAIYYICGPKLFMSSIVQHLTKLGVNRDQIYYEFFGPLGAL